MMPQMMPEDEINNGNIVADQLPTKPEPSAEQITAHPSNVANVVAHVIGDACRVPFVILIHALINLSTQVCANISSFGVDATSDTAEESNSRTTKTITCNSLVQFLARPLCQAGRGS